ncbi:hypothetical protein [Hansschlegelia sp.]|uniref:hypothetical protein n=1 Tax=Hansschlegelia sp. TaxID=2041892 RepID=UPI002BD40DE6|nr:hypothetical protein [Hansschlegelia sp.]HVI30174.1 hypothetical protein [Hansschlegelia sp.]
MAEAAGELLLEVRCLVTGSIELLTVEAASLRSGVPVSELMEALSAFKACATDGYIMKEHETLYAAG